MGLREKRGKASHTDVKLVVQVSEDLGGMLFW